MDISLIITNWNGCALLEKNLAQVIKMSPEAKEIIVADDASTDDSLDYLKKQQKKYKKLKIISHKKILVLVKTQIMPPSQPILIW